MLQFCFRQFSSTVAILLCATSVCAQDLPLSDVFDTSIYRLKRIMSFSPEFDPGAVLTEMFLAELSTFPVGASSAAFTYSFRPDLGIAARDTRTFGPIYAERPYTVGKGRLNFGANVAHATFEGFNGQRFDDGILLQQFFYSGRSLPGDEVRTRLDLSRTSVTFFSNAGVTEWLEVGAIVPIVRVGWNATLTYWDARSSRITFTDSDEVTRTGVGDVTIRTKVKALDGANGAVGGMVEYRFPTGQPANLLGALGPSLKTSVLTTGRVGRLAPHLSAGYTAGWGLEYISLLGVEKATASEQSEFVRTGAPDDLEIAAGTEFEASPSLTLVGDVILRTIKGVGTVGTYETVFHYTDSRGDVPVSALVRHQGDLRTALGAIGFKWGLKGECVLSVSGLFPLTDAGLKPRPGIFAGLDYAF